MCSSPIQTVRKPPLGSDELDVGVPGVDFRGCAESETSSPKCNIVPEQSRWPHQEPRRGGDVKDKPVRGCFAFVPFQWFWFLGASEMSYQQAALGRGQKAHRSEKAVPIECLDRTAAWQRFVQCSGLRVLFV